MAQQSQPDYATAQLTQDTGVGSFLFAIDSNTSGCLVIECSGAFSGQAMLSVPGSAQVTTLTDTIDLMVNVGVSSARGARGFIDPYVAIDPTWAASHPGFTLSAEPGIGNGAVSPIPELSTGTTIAAGMAMIGICIHRRFTLRA